MKRRFRKALASVLTLAVVLTSVTWPDAAKASAAVTQPEEGLLEKNILTESGKKLTSNDSSHDKVENGETKYDGYLQTVNIGDATGKYFKVSYKTEGTPAAETKVFTFQPFDTGWNGWEDNIITIGDSQMDSGKGEYVAYISIDAIKKSYTKTGTLKGINLSFFQKEPAITLTGFSMLVEPTDDEIQAEKDKEAEDAVTIFDDEAKTVEGHETLQEFALADLQSANPNLTLDKIGSAKVTVYIHVTKSSPYSRLKVRGGNLSTGSFSNKELIGKKNTRNAGRNNAHYLHLGYRTSGGYGSGMGVAGSGNYKFETTSVNKGSDDNTAGIRLTRMTTDVEAYMIGIVFGSVGSVSIDQSGNVTNGFDETSANVESWNLDDSDYTDEEYEEANKEAIEKEKKEREAARAGLKSAIDACKAFKDTEYEADSIAKVQAAIPAAEEAYAKEDDTKANYRAARDALEKVRAAMVPKMTTDEGNPKQFRVLSKKEVIAEMGAGINLGNTLDGHSGMTPEETSWQAYKTTKAYIKALHDAGYNTVRVPVTWGTMINEDFSINETWMNRVQEIVDYCTDQDMYCIINIHHDGAANHDNRGNNTPACWLDTYASDIEGVYAKFAGTWKSIANRFKDYDEHLIFESMNEVTDAHDGTANEDTEILNNLNQIFVNTVRSTGSNNIKRWLAFTGRFATFSTGTTMPADPLVSSDAETTRLMFSVHIYKDNSSVRWTRAQLVTWQTSLSSTVKNVQALSNDIPIYVGEYGVRQQVQSGSETGYNNVERALNSEFCNAVAKSYGVCPVVWDQGDGNYVTTKTNTGLFNYWNRPAMEPVYADTIEGMMRGTYLDHSGQDLSTMINEIYMSYGHASISDNSVSTNPEITEISSITVEDEKLTMKAGDYQTLNATVEPSNTNDVLLWSTDDDAIVTVSNGHIHAKAAGITTIHAYSQSKSVTKDIQVIVSPSGKDTATGIQTEKAYYEVTEGESAQINTTLLPADSKDTITYTSSNPEIATVSSSGKINGEKPGSTYIIVTAASGVSTIVKVKVARSPKSSSVDVALNVLIGSITETGKSVNITGDGQYELSYDMDTELSEDGKTAGLTALKDMTAVYIRDCNKLKPVVQSAKIRYDEVIVDGTKLTLKKTSAMDEEGFKNLLKPNGQLDSNDPINGWDGSAVEEVTTDSKKHTVSFNDITDPKKITVKFTIKDMEFFPVVEKENEATEMTTSSETKIALAQVGDSREVELTLAPADTDSFVTFYSTNSSVIAVDSTAKAVDENGKVKVSLTAISDGLATVTAITENGLKVFFSVGVGDVEIPEPTDPTPDGLDGSTPEDPTPTEVPGTTETPGNTEAPGATGTPGTPGVTVKAEQTITVASSLSKAIGSKAFNLGAKTSGDGQLSYASSDTKVAAVDASGKVTVKNYGVTNITITAAATAAYNEAKAVCVLKVVPKAMKISKVKALKGKKMKVTWKQNKKITGYQLQYSQDAKFKKKAKAVSITKNKTTSKVIKGLKKGKYYVRIRAYKKVGKTKLYSSYSKAKKVTVK
ncbi:MAG: cellulase family glycosylhydrolase [Lachnospiraceae bacterium]|nr:cellulase family glycosylhydrolase [Lachnospiraceae bacterium]MBP3458926.1 cellulase family glycosylhydrolase [Lachnospiraceae bacterium]